MKFRKKGVVEAVQVTEEWFAPDFAVPIGVTLEPAVKTAKIGDKLSAKVGDWIILAPKLYPMHDEQFKALYEECGNPTPTMNLDHLAVEVK